MAGLQNDQLFSCAEEQRKTKFYFLDTDMSEKSLIELCRTCLRDDSPTISVFNVVDVPKSITISDMLYDFASIHIRENDKFSTKVCSYCALNIKNSYDFKRICLESEKRLVNSIPTTYFHTNKEILNDTSQCERILANNNGLFTDVNSSLEKIKIIRSSKIILQSKGELTADVLTFDEQPSEKIQDALDESFKCLKCNIKFENEKLLTEHKIDYHKIKFKDYNDDENDRIQKTTSYSCKNCNVTFLQKINYFRHMKTHQSAAHMCMFCGDSFPNAEALHTHRKSHRKIFKCHVCDSVFENGRALLSHRKVHQKIKDPHLCPTCGKAFTTKGNLNAHIRIHSGEKPYVCKTCNKAFASWSALNLHKPTHSDERNFVCTICGSKQKRRSALQAHMRQHTGERKYECTACDKKFFSSAALKDHFAMHTGEKNHLCTTCGKAFSRKKALVVHARSHSEDRPYVCTVCGRAFTQRVVLRTHMKTHQPNLD